MPRSEAVNLTSELPPSLPPDKAITTPPANARARGLLMDYDALQAAFVATQAERDQLRQERDALRQELDTFKSAQSETSKSIAFAESSQQPFRFLSLPKDVRLMIYDICLVPGEIRLRNPEYRSKPSEQRLLNIRLLEVCNEITAEALPLYLGQNLFNIGFHEINMCALGHNGFGGGPFVSYDGHVVEHLRSLSLTFGHNFVRAALDLMAEMVDDDVHKPEPEDYPEAIHEGAREMICDEWLDNLHGFFRLRLKFLRVNLGGCYCPMKCHREVDFIMEQLGEASNWKQGVPSLMEILNTKDKAEREMVRELTSDFPEVRFKNENKETGELYDPTVVDHECGPEDQ